MVNSAWLFVVSVASADVVAGFWRLTCPSRSGIGRLDPIIRPGEPSQHVHIIHGGDGFGLKATGGDLVASTCTSCSVIQDKSAYWVPALYFTPDNETFTLVQQIGGLVAYYELLAGPKETIYAFPPGFQMLSGDSTRRHFTLSIPDPEKSLWQEKDKTQEALAQKAIGFGCLHPQRYERSLARHFLPEKTFLDANCPDGLRAELMFPSCWDGRHIDHPNHKSHVAFSDLVLGGVCPEGHPHRLPSVHYEVTWDTFAFNWRPGTFVFANGDATGYGFHGDFMNGWDTATLEAACNACKDSSGRIEDCPSFAIQPDSEAARCSFSMPLALRDEDCRGPRHLLPGNLSGRR